MRFFSKHNSTPVQTILDRKEQRNSTFGIVEIRGERGSLLTRARLRDLSISGALLNLDMKQTLPDTLSLYFPAEHFGAEAIVKWQDGGSIGVEFQDPIVLPGRLRSRRNRVDVVTAHLSHAGI